MFFGNHTALASLTQHGDRMAELGAKTKLIHVLSVTTASTHANQAMPELAAGRAHCRALSPALALKSRKNILAPLVRQHFPRPIPHALAGVVNLKRKN